MLTTSTIGKARDAHCSQMNSVIESAKQLAATRAVNEWIGRVPRQTAVKAIGIGSGSTVVHVVERLAELAGQPPVYVAV